jgi:hypothetical protein
MERTKANVDDYLAAIEGQHVEDLRLLDRSIRDQLPGQPRFLYEGKFWGGSDQQIVGYGVMDYVNRSGENVEWFLVGLAAQKNYISIYVNAVEDGEYLLAKYKGRLGKVKAGSASISFDAVADLEFETLMELIARAGDSAS